MLDILSLRRVPPAADKRYNDAAIEPDNPCHVSNERPSHDVGDFSLGIFAKLTALGRIHPVSTGVEPS